MSTSKDVYQGGTKNISIIIPVYNLSSYINRCIESILPEIDLVHEIILVDDGSTDESSVLCDRWVQSNSKKIVCIHKENGGVSSARNAGLEVATGDYVFFVDGDDCVSEGAIATITKALANNCDCYLFGYSRNEDASELFYMPIMDESTIQTNDEFHNLIALFLGSSLEELYQLYRGNSFEKELGSVWRMAIKQSVIKENNLRFDETVHLAEDMIFAVTVLEHSQSCQIVHQSIYQYWTRDNSATHRRHSHKSLINNKKSLFEAREKLSEQFPGLREMYEGSAVLSSVQVAMWAASKDVWDRAILKDFCSQPYVKRSYQKLSLIGAPLKYKIPFFLLKHKMYSLMLLAVKTLNTLGISMYGHV